MEKEQFKSELWSAIYLVRTGFQKIVEPIVQGEGISMLQAFILFEILENKEVTVGSLSKKLMVNQGNLSTMCKNMENQGYITRARSKEDERIVTLSIAKKGIEVTKRLHNATNRFDEHFGRVNPEKLDKIVSGIRELGEILKSLSEES